ncbi:MAG: hypothetical protein QW594_01165 [Candidatus Woesearchaeota archaeon]
MYIRIKNIKGNMYGYAVRSTWTKQGPRQISKKYLGRVYALPRISDEPILTITWSSNGNKGVLQALFIHELKAYGFIQKTKKIWIKNAFSARIDSFELKKEAQPILLKNKEGYLCKYLFEKLLRYRPKRKNFDEDAIVFTKLVLALGITIEKEAFIAWFTHLYNH